MVKKKTKRAKKQPVKINNDKNFYYSLVAIVGIVAFFSIAIMLNDGKIRQQTSKTVVGQAYGGFQQTNCEIKCTYPTPEFYYQCGEFEDFRLGLMNKGQSIDDACTRFYLNKGSRTEKEALKNCKLLMSKCYPQPVCDAVCPEKLGTATI